VAPIQWWSAARERILVAFKRAFPNTVLQARYPHPKAQELGIGYHDDSFCQDTFGSQGWFFIPQLQAVNGLDQWKYDQN